MAERYDFYVHDNRKITFNLTEPIMREDSGVTDFVFHIPKILNELEVSDWQWWLVFVNAKKEKYSIALTLSDDPESPLEKNIATYTVDYAMSIKAGSVQFALEAINAGTGGAINNEWHTLTYETKVKETLQGNQAEYAETESDIISALLEEVRNKVNQLVGGATPLPVNLKSLMTDPQKVYLYTGSEDGESTGYWYYHNGTQFVPGGLYASGLTIDPTFTIQGSAAGAKETGVALATKIAKPLTSPNGTSGQLLRTNGDGTTQWVDQGLPTDEQTAEAIDNWLDEHPEATTTVQDGAVTYEKLNPQIKVGVTCSALGMTANDINGDNASILANAINNGVSVFVDDVYQLNYAESFSINKSVNLQGIEIGAGFEITSGSNLFEPTGTIDVFIANVCFTNSNANNFILFYVAPEDATDVLFNDFVIYNCKFNRTSTGYVKLIDYRTVTSTPPASTFGVNKFVFDNNTVDEVKGMFATFIGQPIRHAEITRNYIHNHNSVLYYAAIDNSDEYDTEIKKSREFLLVQDNFVKNDLDFWCTVTANNYNCIIVSESFRIIIRNNYVEGMHCRNDCTMLPFYHSAEYLIYENNTLIDNAVFSETVSWTSIFRCKGIRTHGVYRGNTFIIHDDFAKNVGEEGYEIRHCLILEGLGPENVEIIDNYVYAQSIKGMSLSCQVKNFIFTNNEVYAKKYEESGAIYSVTAGVSKNVKINGNKINIGAISNTVPVSFVYGTMYDGSMTGAELDDFIFESNDVIVGSATQILDIANGINAKRLIIDGNTFSVVSGTLGISYRNQFRGNFYKITNNSFFVPFPIMSLYPKNNDIPFCDVDYEVSTKFPAAYTKGSTDFIYPIQLLTSEGSFYTRYEIESYTNTCAKYAFEVSYTLSNNTHTIIVTKSDGTTTTIDISALTANTQDVTVFDLNSNQFKCVIRAIKLSLNLNAAQIRFYFNNYPKNALLNVKVHTRYIAGT